MTNPNDPAFSAEGAGMTVREHFAALAMQGILANPSNDRMKPSLREAAVAFADLLIVELNKEPPK